MGVFFGSPSAEEQLKEAEQKLASVRRLIAQKKNATKRKVARLRENMLGVVDPATAAGGSVEMSQEERVEIAKQVVVYKKHIVYLTSIETDLAKYDVMIDNAWRIVDQSEFVEKLDDLFPFVNELFVSGATDTVEHVMQMEHVHDSPELQQEAQEELLRSSLPQPPSRAPTSSIESQAAQVGE